MEEKTKVGEPVAADNDYVTVEEASKITGAPQMRIVELFEQGLFSMRFHQDKFCIQRSYLERIEAYAKSGEAYVRPEPEMVESLADNQQLRSLIRHAFADAVTNAMLEDTSAV
jgi:hypothetical protein